MNEPVHTSATATSARIPEQAGGPERQRGAWGWILLWLVGIPVPILLFLFLIRGCT